MLRLAMRAGFAIAVVLACASSASALTQTQSTAAASKVRADALALQRARSLAKSKAELRIRADVVATKVRVKNLTLLSIHAETRRRMEAATRAAEANAKVMSFHSASPGLSARGDGSARVGVAGATFDSHRAAGEHHPHGVATTAEHKVSGRAH